MNQKFSLYKRIESLREYVLISQNEALVEQYVRQGEIWPRSAVAGLDASLVLASVGLEIPLNRLYAKVLKPTRRLKLGWRNASEGRGHIVSPAFLVCGLMVAHRRTSVGVGGCVS